MGARAWTTGVVGRLNAEWAGLADDPAGGEAARRWAIRAPALAGAATLGEVLARVPTAPDEVLGALLAAAGVGDTLAGRVVLQAMLGKVVAMAARDRSAAVDDYLAVLWLQVATYPLARRPTAVAANLALDTLKAVQAERRTSRLVSADPARLVRAADARPEVLVGASREPRAEGAWAAAVIALAREHRVLDPGTSALLHTVYAEGLPGTRAAARHRISPGTLRTRCSRAVRQLAAHADLLAAAG